MNKQKRNQIIGGAAISAVLLGGSVYGLAQNPDSFVSQWFNLNNDANKTTESTNSNNGSQNPDGSNDPLAYNSKEAKEANAKTKFEANKDESWRLEGVYRDPVNSSYVYDPKAKRLGRNETGVTSVDGYKRQVEIYSTVKANTKYRNATDETYEKSLNRLEEGIDRLQKEYLSSAKSGASAFKSDELDKISIQYFASDLSSMKQFPEELSIAGGLTLDKSTFKLRYTSAKGVYAFEVMLNSKKDGQQFTYMSGFYNEQLNYFQVRAAVYMMDGAVAKDKYLQDSSHSQQISHS